jgi:hypothetical protein
LSGFGTETILKTSVQDFPMRFSISETLFQRAVIFKSCKKKPGSTFQAKHENLFKFSFSGFGEGKILETVAQNFHVLFSISAFF